MAVSCSIFSSLAMFLFVMLFLFLEGTAQNIQISNKQTHNRRSSFIVWYIFNNLFPLRYRDSEKDFQACFFRNTVDNLVLLISKVNVRIVYYIQINIHPIFRSCQTFWNSIYLIKVKATQSGPNTTFDCVWPVLGSSEFY